MEPTRTAFAFFLGTASVLLAAAPPHPADGAARAVLTGGLVVTCVVGPEGYWMELEAGGAGGDPAPVVRVLPPGNFGSPRWHVHGTSLWLMSVTGDKRLRYWNGDCITRHELKEYVAGRYVPAPGAAPRDDEYRTFGGRTPSAAARNLANLGMEAEVAGSDVLPLGPGEARQFVLRAAFPGYRAYPATGWSFQVHRCKQAWDEKAGIWSGGGWRLEETLAVAFREPFHAVAKGDDYYFVTDSGKLYHSPPGPKGKERPVRLVWDDPRRVEAIFADADSGKTFLFCHPARSTGKPAYFELSDRPRPVEYDPASVTPPKAAGQLRWMLILARVLLADGQVVLPKKR